MNQLSNEHHHQLDITSQHFLSKIELDQQLSHKEESVSKVRIHNTKHNYSQYTCRQHSTNFEEVEASTVYHPSHKLAEHEDKEEILVGAFDWQDLQASCRTTHIHLLNHHSPYPGHPSDHVQG